MLSDSVRAAINEIKSTPVFNNMALRDVEELCVGGTVVVSNHRERLFDFGSNAHFFGIVLSGAYKLSRPTPSGEDAIVYFCTPGDVLAAFIMAQEHPKYPVTATAMGPSRFLKIPREAFVHSWKDRADLILRIQNLLSNRMGMLQNHKAMTRAPLSAKLAAFLMELTARHSENEQRVVPIPLTRKDIAENLGVTVESVIRVMSDWSKQGLISTTDQQITILRPDKVVEEIRLD